MSDALTWSPTAPMGPRTEEAEDCGSLAAGTRLHEFEIVRVLGAGGFGIVYLAFDHVLLRHVAIKEYMPVALAVRREGSTVAVRSGQAAATFAAGLDSFINEARLLARFDHPSLVKVHRFWQANGTAYMVTPYYYGQTMKAARLAMPAPPDAAALWAFIDPLLGALEVLHGEGVYHRDISPENVLLLPDGKPVLLDFGSARRVIGDRTQSLTALIKPHFAPVEQYADEAGMRQGPWTDIYALGATVYFMVTARLPAPAVLRAVRDSLPPLAAEGGAQFSGVPTRLLASIDWAMALAPRDRPQSVDALRRAFLGETVPPARVPRDVDGPRSTVPGSPPGSDPAPVATGKPLASRHRLMVACLLACAVVLAGFSWVLYAALPSVPRTLVQRPAVTAPVAVTPAPTPLRTVAPMPMPMPMPTAAPAPTPAQTVASTQPAAIRTLRDREPAVGSPKPLPIRPPKTAARPDPAAPARSKQSEPSPREVCSDRNFLTRAICMNRQCQTAQARRLPECAEVVRVEAERQRRMDQQ